jgi:transcriptional regulator with XRE-family HTH domain
MSKLIAIIDEYKDTHGAPSDSSIARAIGVAPQTISSWRTRGIRDLPDRQTLMKLADLVRLDYRTVVLPAVLEDIDYLPTETETDTETG